jgi:shikimate kinase
MRFAPNIILIGFMGSGKTSIGRIISKLLGMHFWDMDEWVEKKNKEKISLIFKKKGERFFRKEEAEAVSWLRHQQKFVASTGGGAWLQRTNRKRLLKSGWCIWLKVSPEDVWKRISSCINQRPILSDAKNPKQKIKALLRIRNPKYAMAHISFDTTGKTPKKVALEIVRVFKNKKPFSLDGAQEVDT